jgi:hypothetical protein
MRCVTTVYYSVIRDPSGKKNALYGDLKPYVIKAKTSKPKQNDVVKKGIT